jgi:hypothetical protein
MRTPSHEPSPDIVASRYTAMVHGLTSLKHVPAATVHSHPDPRRSPPPDLHAPRARRPQGPLRDTHPCGDRGRAGRRTPATTKRATPNLSASSSPTTERHWRGQPSTSPSRWDPPDGLPPGFSTSVRGMLPGPPHASALKPGTKHTAASAPPSWSCGAAGCPAAESYETPHARRSQKPSRPRPSGWKSTAS